MEHLNGNVNYRAIDYLAALSNDWRAVFKAVVVFPAYMRTTYHKNSHFISRIEADLRKACQRLCWDRHPILCMTSSTSLTPFIISMHKEGACGQIR